MPLFHLVTLRARDAVAMAVHILAAEPENTEQENNDNGTIIIVVVTLTSVFAVAIISLAAFFRNRRDPVRIRIADEEEGHGEVPIPLQELPPRTPPPPQSSVSLPLRAPRPLNEYTMPLSSHPPSIADLNAAAGAGNEPAATASHSGGNTQEIVPVPEAGPSSHPSHMVPESSRVMTSQRERRDDDISYGDDPRRRGMVFGSDNGAGFPIMPESALADSSLSDVDSADSGKGKGREVLQNETSGNDDDNSNLPGNSSAAQAAGSSNQAGNEYACLQRDYTNQSLVPTPLSSVRSNPAHETSSSSSAGAASAQPTTSTHQLASAAHDNYDIYGDGDEVIEGEDLIVNLVIHTSRPDSFIIHNLLGLNFPSGPSRSSMHSIEMSPPPEVVEANRHRAQEEDYRQKAREAITEKAKKQGRTLSEETLDRLVEKLYRQSDLYKERPATAGTYTSPPTSPPRSGEASTSAAAAAATQSSPSDGQGQGQGQASAHAYLPPRPPRPPRPEGGLYSALGRRNSTGRQEPAFASSQVLPMPAPMTSITEQEGPLGNADADSTPSTPSRSPTRRQSRH
ncbi:hypothetical protein F5Y14DRAFT_460926 [Nemania sp. NC0429]|nr:hypothetical protein F5Y14DRAFT_460926 [Nemania sp. NC0429]